MSWPSGTGHSDSEPGHLDRARGLLGLHVSCDTVVSQTMPPHT